MKTENYVHNFLYYLLQYFVKQPYFTMKTSVFWKTALLYNENFSVL